MKELLFCVFLCIAFSASSKALEFKGIPIEGDYKEFLSQIESKGLKLNTLSTDMNQCIAVLDAFNEGKEYKVLVQWNPKTEQVYSVGTMMCIIYEDNELLEAIDSLRDSVKEQYKILDYEIDENATHTYTVIDKTQQILIWAEDGMPVINMINLNNVPSESYD